jgi:hypothetical protein
MDSVRDATNINLAVTKPTQCISCCVPRVVEMQLVNDIQSINQSTNQLNFEARGIEILVPDILNQHQLIVQKILPLF